MLSLSCLVCKMHNERSKVLVGRVNVGFYYYQFCFDKYNAVYDARLIYDSYFPEFKMRWISTSISSKLEHTASYILVSFVYTKVEMDLPIFKSDVSSTSTQNQMN